MILILKFTRLLALLAMLSISVWNLGCGNAGETTGTGDAPTGSVTDADTDDYTDEGPEGGSYDTGGVDVDEPPFDETGTTENEGQ